MKKELIDIDHVLDGCNTLIEEAKSIEAIQTESGFKRAMTKSEKIGAFVSLLILLQRGMKPCESYDMIQTNITELLSQSKSIQEILVQYLSKQGN